MKNIVEICGGVARQDRFRLEKEVDFILNEGEQLAIVGSNGAGKSILVGMVTGDIPLYRNEVKYTFSESHSEKVYENIKYITFRDSYGEADGSYYYQQRWNSQDRDAAPLVREFLPQNVDARLRDRLFSLFKLNEMLDKQIVLLSSGELRKFQLAKVILTNPKLLIIDNPFIGLDEKSRTTLSELLGVLISELKLQIVVVLSRVDDIPTFVTDVVMVEKGVVNQKVKRDKYLTSLNMELVNSIKKEINITNIKEKIISLDYRDNLNESDVVVEMNDVTIKYGERVILNKVNWVIKRGEYWALSGDNGSGKSTLLSLVCADNPQSYACKISLFGRKRGSGESIWEIKKRIGYVSPEMHRSFMVNFPAIDIVASGLYDTIGVRNQIDTNQIAISEFWMKIFGIDNLKNKNFMHLSSGEQRMVLLARTFVKDPELLVLDEPFHGLDIQNRLLVTEIIDAFCCRKNKSVIIVSHYVDELPLSVNSFFSLS